MRNLLLLVVLLAVVLSLYLGVFRGPSDANLFAAEPQLPAAAKLLDLGPGGDPIPNPKTGGNLGGGSNQESTALRALLQWHRSGSDLAPNSVAPLALQEFASIWKGQSSSYAALLRAGLPKIFGEEFDRYGKAFAFEGLEALSKELASAPYHGPAWLVWMDALSFRLMRTRQAMEGSRALGSLIHEMLASGYPRDRVLGLANRVGEVANQAADFLPWKPYGILEGDSLDRICRIQRKTGLSLNYGWINIFNGRSLQNTNLRPGRELKLPTDPLRLEAWRGACLLVLYAGNVPIRIWQASFGKDGNATPLGSFTMGDFLEKPVYWPQDGRPSLPYGNRENPLGTRWMGFSEKPSYGIHGNTNSDDSIGSFESLGCIRMHNEEVEELFQLLPRGAHCEVMG